MNPISPRRAINARPASAAASNLPWLVGLLVLCASPAAAQSDGPAVSQPAAVERALLDSSGQALWLAHVEGERTTFFLRGTGQRFDLGRSMYGAAARLVATDLELHIFLDNGNFYTADTERPTPAAGLNLPERYIPIDALGVGRRMIVLAPPEIAAQVAASAAATAPAAPPTASGAGLSLLEYDGRDWRVQGPGPDGAVPQRGAVRLGWAWDQPLVVWRDAEDGLLASQRLESGVWSPARRLPLSGVDDFWVLFVNAQPTVVATGGPDAPGLRAVRLLGGMDAEWTPVEPRLSPLPEGRKLADVVHAAEFNQHIALLTVADDGRPFVQFARADDAPAETTIDVSRVFSEPDQIRNSQRIFELVTFLMLAGVLVGLFVFRRESMLNLVAVPPGMTIAGAGSRLFGFLVDLLPFAFAAAGATGVSTSEALNAVGLWLSPASTSMDVPPPNLMLWWGLTAGGYVVYCAAMELLTRRTVGKVLTRSTVLSERGVPASAGQILARNATRLIELLPPFWIFGLLVLLSRNNQRLGDIFARTYVARRVVLTPPPRRSEAEPGPNGDESKSDAGQDESRRN